MNEEAQININNEKGKSLKFLLLNNKKLIIAFALIIILSLFILQISDGL